MNFRVKTTNSESNSYFEKIQQVTISSGNDEFREKIEIFL